jgi:GST-like protein
MTDYTPPKVWTWNAAERRPFANINRPVAGPTHEKALPVGRTRSSSTRSPRPTA